MTVPINDRRIQYVAIASQTIFPYDFEIFSEQEIEVIKTIAATGASQTLILTNDYTVTNVGNDNGGNIVLNSGTENDDVITITGKTLVERNTDFNQAGNFLMSDLNDQLDRLTRISQESSTSGSRAVTLKDSDTADSLQLPVTSERISKFLAFDSNGEAIASPGSVDEVPTTDYTRTFLESDNATEAKTVLELDNDVTFDNMTINNKLNTQPNAATILNNEIDYTGEYMVIDTEGGTATDDLDTINGGRDGDRLLIRTANDARDITIRDEFISGGNIRNTKPRDQNRTLVLVDDVIQYQYTDGFWYETSRSLDSDLTISEATTTASGFSLLPEQITIENDSGDTNHDILFNAGNFNFDDGSGQAVLSSNLVKQIDAAWLPGNNQGGLDTGTVAINTWYYCYVISNDDGSIVDCLFSASPTSPTLPVGYTKKKRVRNGFFKTNLNGDIKNFSQSKDFYVFTGPQSNNHTLLFSQTSQIGSTGTVTDAFPSLPIQAFCTMYMDTTRNNGSSLTIWGNIGVTVTDVNGGSSIATNNNFFTRATGTVLADDGVLSYRNWSSSGGVGGINSYLISINEIE